MTTHSSTHRARGLSRGARRYVLVLASLLAGSVAHGYATYDGRLSRETATISNLNPTASTYLSTARIACEDYAVTAVRTGDCEGLTAAECSVAYCMDRCAPNGEAQARDAECRHEYAYEVTGGCACHPAAPEVADLATVVDVCPDAAGRVPSGIYTVPAVGDVYCDTVSDGGGWALLYNAVGDPNGLTPDFWRMSYDNRLEVKGAASLSANYYDGALYRYLSQLSSFEVMDVIEDMDCNVAVAFHGAASGFALDTMAFNRPTYLAGSYTLWANHMGSGWSSYDHDGDNDGGSTNCAALYGNIAQHYGGCWRENLGVSVSGEDRGWGPHVFNEELARIGLNAQPGASPDSRVHRITRLVRWTTPRAGYTGDLDGAGQCNVAALDRDGGREPDVVPSGTECSVDEDCRLYASSCGACFCEGLSRTASPPRCERDAVACTSDPCAVAVATCDNGVCVAGR